MSQNCGCDKEILDQLLSELLYEKGEQERLLPEGDRHSDELDDCIKSVRDGLAELYNEVSNLVVVEIRGGVLVEVNGLLAKQRLLVIDWDDITGG